MKQRKNDVEKNTGWVYISKTEAGTYTVQIHNIRGMGYWKKTFKTLHMAIVARNEYLRAKGMDMNVIIYKDRSKKENKAIQLEKEMKSKAVVARETKCTPIKRVVPQEDKTVAKKKVCEAEGTPVNNYYIVCIAELIAICALVMLVISKN